MIKFADFCAGIGGFRLGLEKLGWECAYSCEIDQQCQEVYRANFGTDFDGQDIRDVNPNRLPDIDVLCAGFPCQPFSIAGSRLGLHDPRGKVLFELLRITSVVKPPVLFLENVANFVSSEPDSAFRFLLTELNKLGYDVHYSILDSANFGVPQRRRRVFIVGFRREFSSLFFTLTKHRTSVRPYRECIARGDFSIPITDRWQEYIDLYTGQKTLADMSFEVPKTRLALERESKDVNLLDCIMQIRSSGIRAYSIDAPFPTLAVSHSGGGPMIPVYTGERRHISMTEMKRIMGFPDGYQLPVSKTHAIKQLANSVCPPVITSVGQDIQNVLQLSATQPVLFNAV